MPGSVIRKLPYVRTHALNTNISLQISNLWGGGGVLQYEFSGPISCSPRSNFYGALGHGNAYNICLVRMLFKPGI